MQVAHLGKSEDPHIVEAEQCLLGGLLLNPDTVGMVPAIDGVFFDAVHGELVRVIRERVRDGLTVSPVALATWAKSHAGMHELGGAQYLMRLVGTGCPRRDIGHYVDILMDQRAKRNILGAARDAAAAIERGEEEAATIAGRLEAALVDLQPANKAKPVSMLQAVRKAAEQVAAACDGDTTGSVMSGFPSLDKIVTGFYPGELILLGGRPSMGKTAVALSMALNVARQVKVVVISSLEMNPEAMALRAISEATTHHRNAVSYSDMRRGELREDQREAFGQAARDTAELPITFLSREFADIGALLSGAKQARRMLGDEMSLFIVDYAQLLRAKAATRYEEITKISIALKALAGQLDVPVLALSQLSRALESRDDKRPMLSDLRESGQLEQDADAVMFCFREQYYLEREEPDLRDEEAHSEWRKAHEAARNRLEIIVAKQRQGAIGTARMMCNPALNKIWEQ